MNSIASDELRLDPEIKIAVIYSIVESSSFLVELHYQAKSSYISKGDNPVQYPSLSMAKQAAQREGAIEGFQALENIYQEVGSSRIDNANANLRFEYIHFDFKND